MNKSKQTARYPDGYAKLKHIENNTAARTARFPSVDRFRQAQQFCTRYRLAASLEGIKLSAFTNDRTGESYGALFRVFTCYTALEMMLAAIGKNEKSFRSGLSGPKDTAAATNVLAIGKSRDFLIRLRDEHDPQKGKTVITAINQYLKSGMSLPALMYAKAVRNAFAHGRLPSAPGNVGPVNVISICETLCEYLLCLMNDEFSSFMK